VNPTEYLDSLDEFFASSPLVSSYQITRHQASKVDAYMRVIITFADASRLEAMEYVRSKNESESVIARYSYHWMGINDSIIARWDNAEHYPDLPGFPHHFHDGDEKKVIPSEPMSLFKVFDIIATRLKE
jgi:hypothetical protein